MKKSLLLTFFLVVFANAGIADLWIPDLKGTRINLQVYWKDHSIGQNDFPQELVQIPTVSIDGRTLYFYDVFSSTVPVVIVDSNDEVVFSDYLYCGADKIMLPASLTGTFTVYMRVGTILYCGSFTL